LSGLDWAVLVGALLFFVVYGVVRGGRQRSVAGYLLAGKQMRWGTITLSIMATQASAITFLSTPGQAYADGMRFVQFYLGLPLAMVVLSISAVPLYHRLKVYTAYEYLERRFDAKTRALAASMFLVQRGLAVGLTIYAPSLILSVILGWDVRLVTALIAGLVVIYTTTGGTRAVSRTQAIQMLVIWFGMAATFATVVALMPRDVSFFDALRLAGDAGRLNAIDTHFDLTSRYNLWSGLIGGMFLALSYFGTDQSQVQRYLSGRSIAESRMGLLANGLVKVPMQFGILFIGVTVFAFYQLVAPPLFFNPVETARMRASADGPRFAAIEARHMQAASEQALRARSLVSARRAGNAAAEVGAKRALDQARSETLRLRQQGVELIAASRPGAPTSDTNYVFLWFVVHRLPAGIVGLVLAAVFAASMSSSSAELNALASTTVVDVYQRFIRPVADERHYVRVSRVATVLWTGLALLFAEWLSRLGSLVEAVNILGSLFYGTILGIFLAAFYLRRATGTVVFVSAVLGEAVVMACYAFTPISFLWYNVVGCGVVVVLTWLLSGRWVAVSPLPARSA
jgi:solute:Na+ symporter, SSS family